MINDGVEIGGGRAVADADHGEDLAVRLEVFPGAGRGAAEDELEPETAGVPGLMRERRLLMLRVERTHRRERDRLVPLQHRPVLPQEARRDRPDRQDRHSDHARSLDAHVWLHSWDRRGGAGFRCGDGRIRSGPFGSTTLDCVTLNTERGRDRERERESGVRSELNSEDRWHDNCTRYIGWIHLDPATAYQMG